MVRETGVSIRRRVRRDNPYAPGHTSGVTAVAVLDKRRVVSTSQDQTLRVWDVESGETTAIFALDCWVTAVAVTDGRIIAGDSAGGVHFLTLCQDPNHKERTNWSSSS